MTGRGEKRASRVFPRPVGGMPFAVAAAMAAIPDSVGAQARLDTGEFHVVESVPPPGAPVRGPRFALVTIEEFSCFPCPSSAEIQAPIRDALRRHGERIRLVFRHFPQAQYAHSQVAAEAACEARAQGRFWPYHDALFARGGRLDREDLLRAAVQARLNVTRLRRALDDGRHRGAVRSDVELARARGIRLVPTLVVNGEILAGSHGTLDLERAVTSAMGRARELRARGVPLTRLFEVMLGADSATGAPFRREHVSLGSAPRLGSDDARVTIVLFADLAETQTALNLSKLQEIQSEFRADLRVAFRNAPGGRPLSDSLAYAAAEAVAQGLFWQFAERLRSTPRDVSAMERAAEGAGLDLAELRAALADGRHRAAVDADRREAERLSVNTGALFVNGRLVPRNAGADELRALIEEERRGGFLGRLR